MSWTIQPVVFHTNHGKNIELSQNNTVATRVSGFDYGIVCTSEPVPVGQMFKVTVLEKDERFVGGFGVYFTTEDPKNLGLINSSVAFANRSERVNLIGRCGQVALHRFWVLGKFKPHTQSLKVGASIGIMLSKTGVLRCFVDGESCGMTTINIYPTNRLLWGVVDVYANCRKIIAHICTSTILRSPQQLIADLERQLQELTGQLQTEKESNADLRVQVGDLEQQCQDKQELQPKQTEERVRENMKTSLNEQLVQDLDFWKTDAESKNGEIDKLKGELAQIKERLDQEEKDRLQQIAQVQESEQQVVKELEFLKTDAGNKESEINKLKNELAQIKERFDQEEKHHLQQIAQVQDSSRQLEQQLMKEFESWKVDATNKDNKISELDSELVLMKEQLDCDRMDHQQRIAQEQERTKAVEVQLKEEQETRRIEAERKLNKQNSFESTPTEEQENDKENSNTQVPDHYRQALLRIREIARRTLNKLKAESQKEGCHPQLHDPLNQHQVSQEGVVTVSKTSGVQSLQCELEKKAEEIQKQADYIDELQAQIRTMRDNVEVRNCELQSLQCELEKKAVEIQKQGKYIDQLQTQVIGLRRIMYALQRSSQTTVSKTHVQ